MLSPALVEPGHLELPQQVLLKRLPAHHGVLEGGEIGFLPDRLGAHHVVTRVGVVVQVVLPVRDPVGDHHLVGGFGLTHRLGGVFFVRCFLEGRILLQFLGDPLLQVEMGELKELDGLLQLGRHHQLRHEFLGELEFECHRTSVLSGQFAR